MEFNSIINHVYEGIIIIVIAILSVLLKPLVSKISEFLDQKASSIKTESVYNLFKVTLDFIDKLAEQTVEYLEQEYGAAIRKGIVNGNSTREELYSLKDKAVEIIMSQITDEMRENLSKKLPNIESYVDNLVSEKVKKMKDMMAK